MDIQNQEKRLQYFSVYIEQYPNYIGGATILEGIGMLDYWYDGGYSASDFSYLIPIV